MPDARRDRWGRYLVVPPAGGKPVGYTRVTTVAKSLDDGGGLIPWKATLAVTGLLRRSGLRGRFEALLSQHPDAGPWYGSAESKAAAKKLIEECAEAGGSSDRADVGTALHSMIEQLNKGATPLATQESTKADLAAYARAIDAAGITFDPELIEAMVVLDEYGIAGTADIGHANVPALGEIAVIADLKTGADLKYSWQAIAVQLATYVHADNVYVQGASSDGSEDRRLPMPRLSKEIGLVIHLPAGASRCELFAVDLVAGWEAFHHSVWARQWRVRKDLARPIDIALATSTASASLDDFDAPVATPKTTAATAIICVRSGPNKGRHTVALPDFDTPPVSATVPATVAERPEPVPPQAPANPSLVGMHDFDAPPAAAVPAMPSRGAQRAVMPKRPAEGDRVDEADFGLLQQRYEQLAEEQRSWLNRLMSEAFTATVSFHAKQAQTVRRFEIIRGLVMLAENDGADDEVMRALVSLALGSDAPLFPAITAGHAVGALDVDAAKAFALHAESFIAGRFGGFVGADELFRLQPQFI